MNGEGATKPAAKADRQFEFADDEVKKAEAQFNTAQTEFDESQRNEGARGLVRILATILVERDSHKAILIGKKGSRLKEIGTKARHGMERLLGAKVFLQLHVRVEPGWTQSSKGLRRAGYED